MWESMANSFYHSTLTRTMQMSMSKELMDLKQDVLIFILYLLILIIVELIEEELENYESVPEWKVKLVESRLKTIIFNEDNDLGASLNASMKDGSGKLKLNDLMNKAANKNNESF
jgi:hypothetical protein